MSLKKQADDLLAVAAEIEKQAAEVTTFVCPSCNHTTTLAKINAARKAVASEIGENVVVSDIAVSDKVACPAPGCEGVLAYQETEASQPYYYDTEKEAKKHSEKTETAEQEAAESLQTQQEERAEGKHASSEPVDYDAIDRYLKG